MACRNCCDTNERTKFCTKCGTKRASLSSRQEQPTVVASGKKLLKANRVLVFLVLSCLVIFAISVGTNTQNRVSDSELQELVNSMFHHMNARTAPPGAITQQSSFGDTSFYVSSRRFGDVADITISFSTTHRMADVFFIFDSSREARRVYRRFIHLFQNDSRLAFELPATSGSSTRQFRFHNIGFITTSPPVGEWLSFCITNDGWQ